MNNLEIARYTERTFSVISKQIQITNNLLVEHDMFNEMLNRDNIIRAVELAISSRKYTDQYYDKREFDLLDIEFLILKVSNRIQSGLFEQKRLYTIDIPKNRIEARNLNYYDLASYSIRFLITQLIFDRTVASDCSFGGKEEIFKVHNSEVDLYKIHSESFWSWQKEQIKSSKYEWVYIADIRHYYASISTDKLVEILESEFNIKSPRFLSAFKQCFNEISFGCWCDHFLQNLYLKCLDNKLSNIPNISYARLTDDIRVFCKNEIDCITVHEIILETLNSLGLSLNDDKQFIIEPITHAGSSSTLPSKVSNEHFVYNWIYDKSQKHKFSHFIKIDEIDRYEIDNILRITNGSETSHTWCRPKYEQELPRKLTLKELVEGKSGFKLGKYDLNVFIEFLEKAQENEIGEQEYEKLAYVIQYSFMNYKFYQRVIKLYLELLCKTISSTTLQTSWSNLIKALGYYQKGEWFEYNYTTTSAEIYKVYALIRALFTTFSNKNLTYYDVLNQEVDIDIDLIGITVTLFKVDSKDTDYLLSELIYLINSGAFDEIKLENDEVLFKSLTFWNDVINSVKSKAYYRPYMIGGLLNNIIKVVPNSIELTELIAPLYYEQKRYEEAMYKYKYLIKMNRTVSFFRLAYCCAEAGFIDDAILYYTEQLHTNKESGAYNNRALLFLEKKDYLKALQDLGTAISLKPEELYYSNRATVLSEMQDYGAAINDLDKAYSFNKNNQLIKRKAQIFKQANMLGEARIAIDYYCDLQVHSASSRQQEISSLMN